MISTLETFIDIPSKLQQVNELIHASIHSDITLLKTALDIQLKETGKQIRPQLVLMTAASLNDMDDTAITLAAIIQMLHVATLMHDDVIDESDTRRNKPNTRNLLGNKTSILAGDFIYAASFDLIAKLKNTEITERIAKATLTILSGEVRQWQHQVDQSFDESTYQKIIAEKTAKLFELATSIICHTNTKHQPYLKQLVAFGQQLGTAFQMIDDILDYSDTSGKPMGIDFFEKKATLPILKLLQQATSTEQKLIKQTFGIDLTPTLTLLKQYHILEQCRQQANGLLTSATQQLSCLPNTQAQKDLIQLSQTMAHRKF